MLDKLRLTIGCIFESTANTSAAGFSLFADSVNLCQLQPQLAVGVGADALDLALLVCKNFVRTFDGIVRVCETGGILAVFAVAAVFAIALRLSFARATLRVVSRTTERALPRTIRRSSLYVTNPT